jgi:hypothetical protein
MYLIAAFTADAKALLKTCKHLGRALTEFADGAAVGDVKYRYLGRDWDRSTFNQAVTFATGFGADRCAVIGFTGRAADALPRPVKIGPVSAEAFSWAADQATDPEESLGLLVESCRRWLSRRSSDTSEREGSAGTTIG